MEKRIVIIGAGELQVPIIRTAKDMGIYTIVVDRDPNAPGFAIADLQVQADTMNPDEVLLALEPYGAPNGVVTAGTDASLTVAKVAEKYHLIGHSVDAAEACTNKVKMRQVLKSAGVSVPEFYPVSSVEQAHEAFQRLGGRQAIIKPSGNMGARGVSLVTSEALVADAFNLAWNYASKTRQVLVEAYKEGKEISVDALVYNNTITITGVADRIIELAPYFVETGHILPSSLPRETIEEALLLFRDAVKALGLTAGAAKGDIKITKNGPVIIEVAARLSGGFMSAYTFPLATGINLNQWMLKLAMGESLPSLKPTLNKVSIERAVLAPAGKIKSIFVPEGLDVAHLSIRKKVGDIMPQPKNNLDKIGNVIVVGSSRKDALQKANKALRSIKIVVDPELEIASLPPERESILPKHLLVPQYIHHIRQGKTTCTIADIYCQLPVFLSVSTDLIGFEQANSIVKGAFYAGTLSFVNGINCNDLILQNFGHAIGMAIPSGDNTSIHKQLETALEMGAWGVGIDLSGASRGREYFSAQNDSDIQKLATISPKIFVVKGILSISDALLAVKSGATHLILSSRKNSSSFFVSAVDMLPLIREAVSSKVSVFIEIENPSSSDIIKCLILGADGIVLPQEVVPSSSPQKAYDYLRELQTQLEKLLPILGVENISMLKGKTNLLLNIS